MKQRCVSSSRTTTKVVAASGRLRNEHFQLTADHLLMEVDPASFELVSAMAEGNIEVHMTLPTLEGEYVIYAQSAVYQPNSHRLRLSACVGTNRDGEEFLPVAAGREVVLPTDGSFQELAAKDAAASAKNRLQAA